MTVRVATVEDLPAIVRMAARFRRETAYAGHVDEDVDQLEKLTRFLVEHGVVFVADTHTYSDQVKERERNLVGMLGAMVVANVVDNVLTGTEVAWWVDPEYRGRGTAGVRLLAAVEAWAVTQGARRFQMIAPAANARVGELYRRRGYTEIETIWQRELAA